MTASDAAGTPRNYRAIMWLAHREPHALALFVVTDTGYRVGRWLVPASTTPTVAVGLFLLSLASVLSLVWALAGLISASRHVHALCTRCARNTPLDGPAAAARHDRALRIYHWINNRPFLRLALPAIVVVNGLFTASIAWRLVLTTPVYVWWTIDAAAGLRHRPLEPWCPYCRRRRRWDDGGDPEVVPDPDPAQQKVRT
jgi:hypothetical protein